ncbi:MAG: ParA family protein [Sphingobacteriaceae bacterium]|nr:MAG: ParA family protein [Sphingobacteriaceae bacterium]
MKKIITLAHQKGGVGKSTLSLNLAYSFKDHLNTALIDLDPQGTISQLKPMINGIDVYNGSLKTISSTDHEIIIVDTPPYLSADFPKLFSLSDLVIIPTKAGIADLMAIRSTINMLKDAMKLKPQLKTKIVFNMVKSSSSIFHEIKEMLDEYQIAVFDTMISDRVSFVRSLAANNGIYSSEDAKAKEEVDALTGEIISTLNS